MLKKLFFPILVFFVFFLSSSTVYADLKDGTNRDYCNPGDTCCSKFDSLTKSCEDDGSFDCQRSVDANGNAVWPGTNKPVYQCLPSTVKKVFGKIPVPGALGGLIANNPTGAGAISQFLSNFITLLFSVAAIVLVFMIIWAAFEWITSGGDKEKLAAAQKRILHAIIGMILFAVAFAVIRIFGVFTGFTFFTDRSTPSSTPLCEIDNCNGQNCLSLPGTIQCFKRSSLPGDCYCK